MPFKFDDKGQVVLQEVSGQKMPVFIHPDGREAPFDGDTTVANTGRLNGEAKSHREGKEAAELKLRAFDGIEDAEAARKAIELAKNIKEGDLVAAGKVQEIKDAAARTAQEQVAAATRAAQEREKALTEQNTTLTNQLNNHIIGGSFTTSKFIGEKLAIPADIAQKVFGDRFKVEAGKLIPLDQTGNPIFSATRHGEHADFEEAIAVMVAAYPNKEMILKGSGASGGGAGGGGGGAGKGGTDLSKLPPVERMNAARAAQK
jgi:hypothetical protein